MQRAVLVLNRRSGSGETDNETLVRRLRDGGIDVGRPYTPEPSEIAPLIEREAESVDLVILGGGDGTFSHAVGAVAASGKPLGVLPMGTANDFARSLRIPFDLDQAVGVIADGQTRRIDLGLVNGRPFLNVASVGFAAEVARFHDPKLKSVLGVFSYPFSWIKAYRRHRPFHAEIVYDGERLRCRCSQLAVGNGRHYGGGLTIADDAEIDDGHLTLYYVEPLGMWEWMAALPSLRFGRLHRFRRAVVRRAISVDVATSRPRQIDVDGELADTTPAEFRIRPQALAVFAPAAVATTGVADMETARQ